MEKAKTVNTAMQNNFGRLFFFELKKIFHKKLAWITIGIMMLLVGFVVGSELIGEYWINGEVVDSNYNQFVIDRDYAKALSGRALDQELLEETFAGYSRVPVDNLVVPYIATEEYQQYARPYSPVFNLVRDMTKMTTDEAFSWKPDERGLYELWHEKMRKEWEDHYLSAEEKLYWEQKAGELEEPLVYSYNEGYYLLFRVLLTMGFITLMAVSVCLADIFPRERIRRTDQLSYAAKNGKKLYFVKILTGCVTAAAIALLLSTEAILLALILYGSEGFTAALQLVMPLCAYPASAGAAVLTAYGLLIGVAVFWGVFVMTLSEVCRNNIAALAIASGLLMLSMFMNVPEEYRVVSQIWGYFPGAELLSYWGVFEPRLVPFFGGYLTKWQFAPFLYTVLGGLMLLPGRLSYGRKK